METKNEAFLTFEYFLVFTLNPSCCEFDGSICFTVDKINSGRISLVNKHKSVSCVSCGYFT